MTPFATDGEPCTIGCGASSTPRSPARASDGSLRSLKIASMDANDKPLSREEPASGREPLSCNGKPAAAPNGDVSVSSITSSRIGLIDLDDTPPHGSLAAGAPPLDRRPPSNARPNGLKTGSLCTAPPFRPSSDSCWRVTDGLGNGRAHAGSWDVEAVASLRASNGPTMLSAPLRLVSTRRFGLRSSLRDGGNGSCARVVAGGGEDGEEELEAEDGEPPPPLPRPMPPPEPPL